MALKTEELYEKASELASEFDDNFLELGKVLRQLRQRDAELFKKLISKTKLHSRKVYYLISIIEAFDGLPASKAKMREVGWTKLMVLAPYVNVQNVEELLELALTLSTAQLKSHVKGVEPITNSHCVLMYFSPEQYSVFEQTLVKHGAVKQGRGILDKEAAIIKVFSKVK